MESTLTFPPPPTPRYRFQDGLGSPLPGRLLLARERPHPLGEDGAEPGGDNHTVAPLAVVRCRCGVVPRSTIVVVTWLARQ